MRKFILLTAMALCLCVAAPALGAPHRDVRTVLNGGTELETAVSLFGGAALILYGYIACSGVKILQQTDLNQQKNLILVSAVLSLGISGIAVGGMEFAISGTALALVFGIILNLALKEKNNPGTKT